MTFRRLVSLLMMTLLAGGLQAAETISNSAGLAFPSVQESGSARAIGLGSTYVGVAEGSAALLWNPAGLGDLLCPELAVHHKSGLLGAFQETAVFGTPLGAGHGLALSVNYGDNGVFEGRDDFGNPTSDYTARTYGASLGWGFNAMKGLGLGLAVKVNRQDLDTASATAVAGDLGLKWNPSDFFSFGAAYSNLGPDVDGYPLAQGLRAGISSYLNKGQDYQWLLAVSGESLRNSDTSLHLGLENTLFKTLALRAGYGFNLSNPVEANGLAGWTFGAGIALNRLSLDYAFVPLGDVGNSQRISLTVSFGNCEVPKAKPVVKAKPARKTRPVAQAQPAPVVTPVPTQAVTPVPTAVPTPAGKKYTVKEGDTLWDISGKKKMRGDSSQWPLLHDDNVKTIDDPDLIYPDQELKYQKDYTKKEVKDAKQTSKDTPAK